MSTEQSVDPSLIEETKAQIRSLVNEISLLAKQDLAPHEFYGEFLNRVVSALAAVGGAVWAINETGAMELLCQINFRETGIGSSQENLNRHGGLVHHVMTTGEARLIAPDSSFGDNGRMGNPSDFLLLMGPVRVENVTKSVVEIFQRPGAPPNTQRGYLRFLLQMCEMAADYLKSRQLRQYTDRQSLWQQLENFTREAHKSLDPRQVAYTIANEGRRLIECDRVTVAVSNGRKCQIKAVSGQDTFDTRSDTIYLLNRLANAVVATSEPMWYTGDTSNLAPQVETALQEYLDAAHSKSVAVLPLSRPPKPRDKSKDLVDKDTIERGETVGALIVEQIDNARTSEGMIQRVNVVTDHSSTALANALEHDTLFLMPVWRTLGNARWILAARTLPKTIAIATTILAVLVGAFVIPADFDLEGRGALQPVTRRDIFAPQQGTIIQYFVNHGDAVKKGQLLLELHNSQLDTSIVSVMGQRNAVQESLKSLDRQISEGNRLPQDEKNRLRGLRGEKQKELDSYIDQIKILEEKKKQLKVLSSIDGRITTWDVEKTLMGRSVDPGQIMLNVADPSKEWELEINMPEDRMGHIRRAQHLLGKELTVYYILATDPGKQHVGRVKDVSLSTDVKGEEGNTVLVRVAIDKNELLQSTGLPELRPGATVKAQVNCGRCSIGYRYFHDLIGWFQTQMFKFF
jgi:multidrug efflux pump subunit AcrA (membrane-fusion protein)